MSRYTTEFGTIYDSGFVPLLEGLAAYPIFSEEHRAELNQKIYNHYRFREIGFETAAMFTHYFITLLNEIMPYYNELYRTAALDFDILSDSDLTESETLATTTDTTGSAYANSQDATQTATTTHDSRGRSDTPQGSFNFSDVTANNYLTEAEATDGTAAASSNSSGNSSSTSAAHGTGQSARTKRITGKSPGRSYADLLREYRETVLNVDKMIIDELNICFMGVY